jgi:hypothetical protein
MPERSGINTSIRRENGTPEMTLEVFEDHGLPFKSRSSGQPVTQRTSAAHKVSKAEAFRLAMSLLDFVKMSGGVE